MLASWGARLPVLLAAAIVLIIVPVGRAQACQPGSTPSGYYCICPDGSLERLGYGCPRQQPRCPQGTTYCSNTNQCCNAVFQCSRNGCIPDDAMACGSGSCKAGTRCSRDEKHCLQSGQFECGSKICGAGSKCGSGDKCLAKNAVDCGGGRSCSAGTRCMDAGARCLTPQQIAQEQAAAQGQARTRADAQRQQAAQQQRQAQLQQTQQQSAKQLQQIGTSQNCAVCQIYAIAYPGQRCPYACPGSGSSQNGTIVPPVQNVLTT